MWRVLALMLEGKTDDVDAYVSLRLRIDSKSLTATSSEDVVADSTARWCSELTRRAVTLQWFSDRRVTNNGNISTTTTVCRRFLLNSADDVLCLATGCHRHSRPPVFSDRSGRETTSVCDVRPSRPQTTRPSSQQAVVSTTAAALGCSARLAPSAQSEGGLLKANYRFKQH